MSVQHDQTIRLPVVQEVRRPNRSKTDLSEKSRPPGGSECTLSDLMNCDEGTCKNDDRLGVCPSAPPITKGNQRMPWMFVSIHMRIFPFIESPLVGRKLPPKVL